MMEEAMNPETFQRFLKETGNEEKFTKIKQQAARAGNVEVLNQVVEQINDANIQPVMIHVHDIWKAWPVFVEECYGGKHPQWFSESDKTLNDFMHWMITNDNYAFCN